MAELASAHDAYPREFRGLPDTGHTLALFVLATRLC